MEEISRGLGWDEFVGGEGRTYTVQAGSAEIEMRLDRAQMLSDSGREGGSFRLEFVGPAASLIPQGIYRFTDDGGDREIFIVPIAHKPDGARYEAVFY
ncbi:MAG: hypothetical protein EOP58_04700 [Sphingomonadales bacterium]|nr:MAG: hypothetical protein EOP58_04700 [Sphingomonadales bacterium]